MKTISICREFYENYIAAIINENSLNMKPGLQLELSARDRSVSDMTMNFPGIMILDMECVYGLRMKIIM